MDATATATDSLLATAEDTQTIPEGGPPIARRLRRSLFENRVNWGSQTPGFETIQGPTLDIDLSSAPAGPLTIAHTFTALAPCELTEIGYYKHPDMAGTIPYKVWDSTQTVLGSGSIDLVADEGGWITIFLPAPIPLTQDVEYTIGIFVADNNYVYSPWVWNSQDTVVWPMKVLSMVEIAGIRTHGSGTRAGGTAPVFPDVRHPTNYYIDPVVEMDDDLPGFEGDDAYFDQFLNGGSSFNFPVAIYYSDPEFLEQYAALGINTLINGPPTSTYIQQIKTLGMDWYIPVHGGDMTGPVAVQEDTVLAPHVRGYLLTDEPDLVTPYNPPATLLQWLNSTRRRDSTRPILLNLSYNPVKNQGFTAQPPGGTPLSWNQSWRDYAELADILSCDFYSLAASDSFSQSPNAGNEENRYGIWAYPPQIRRMAELSDGRIPIFGIVETTSQIPDRPTPVQVYRATWALIIAGARGITFFDHRFGDSDVTQDFADMLDNAPMSAMVEDLCAELQTLGPIINQPYDDIVTEYESSGLMAAPLGGYAEGAPIPVHYTSRITDTATYLFVQAIRPGDTTVTMTIPGLPDQVWDIIGGGTVTADSEGQITLVFDDDYEVFLLTADEVPSPTIPVNTVAPTIRTDGTPRVGETVSCSNGSWDGWPAPTYSYQWERDGVPISGATSATYLLAALDEAADITCVVTGTNAAGSDSGESAAIVPAAPPSTTYSEEVLATNPVAYWRLADLTDSSGNGHTLVSSGSVTSQPSLLAGDPSNGAKGFTFSGSSLLTAEDATDLNPLTAITMEAWIKPQFDQQAAMGKGNHAILTVTSKFRFMIAIPGNVGVVTSVTSWVAGTAYHVVGTYDGTTLKLYIDGDLDASVTFSSALEDQTGDDFLIGNAAVGSYFAIDATIDEVAFYDHALTAGEILSHYQVGSGS